MNNMPFKVKLISYRSNFGKILHRQSKSSTNLSNDGRYEFFIDDDVNDADFFVIHGKGVKEPVSCHVAQENTLLLTTEPNTIFEYPQNYIKQFGVVHSSQIQTKHKNIIYGPALIPWFVGCTENKNGELSYTLDYDGLISSSAPDKTKLISVITSNKVTTQGHLERIRFVQKLKQHYGDKIDVFGRGIKDFEDKWEVLAPYKYHISLENSSTDFYWTEKLADCYLSETFPIYYGCKNISNYFPETAFASIDINNFDQAVQIIDKVIHEEQYEKNIEVLKECKHKILNEYNIFDYIAKICDSLDPNLPKTNVVIKPCVSLLNKRNLLHYVFMRNYYKLKRKVTDYFIGSKF